MQVGGSEKLTVEAVIIIGRRFKGKNTQAWTPGSKRQPMSESAN